MTHRPHLPQLLLRRLIVGPTSPPVLSVFNLISHLPSSIHQGEFWGRRQIGGPACFILQRTRITRGRSEFTIAATTESSRGDSVYQGIPPPSHRKKLRLARRSPNRIDGDPENHNVISSGRASATGQEQAKVSIRMPGLQAQAGMSNRVHSGLALSSVLFSAPLLLDATERSN